LGKKVKEEVGEEIIAIASDTRYNPFHEEE
jgi:hypothetical protein